MMLLGLLLGLLVGLTLGVLGGGGSVLTVPIFVFAMGIETKSAIAMSLAVVGTTSLVGAAGHWRQGNISARMAFVFGAFAMTGSYLGGRLSHYLAGEVQLTIFAVVMFVAALLMFRGRDETERPENPHGRAYRTLLIAIPAVAVGFLTGMIGVGGGFLIVPVLVLLGGVPMKKAIGSSLLVIAMTAAAGFAGQMSRHVPVQWGFMVAFTAVAVLGILSGAAIVPHIPQKALRKAFALFLILMALLILYENRTVFLG